MKKYLHPAPWKIVESGFHKEYSQVSESIFSLGNGRFGQRGNFEEGYSGNTLQGNYFAGIYYPDKTRVGWWKNGYPEYFAKVLNAVNWAGLTIHIGSEKLDLNVMEPLNFTRTLDMRKGLLQRHFEVSMDKGTLAFDFERFCSADNNELGLMRMQARSGTYAGPVTIEAFLDWDVVNEDANWDEKFWKGNDVESTHIHCRAMATTLKTSFAVSSAMTWLLNGKDFEITDVSHRDKYCSITFKLELSAGDSFTFDKFTAHQSSFYHDRKVIWDNALQLANSARSEGYESLRDAHETAWAEKWRDADVLIDGDVTAQQSIRFNIFQLLQTYTGEDARLNIGPKGFTGEKYGGSTYWDTEAYCLPFYLGSGDPGIAKQLLVYRYKHLAKAIENAEKLGFTDGAALYPMVTMNGEECHNEWEITFEEIHRNGAIAYAIYDYIRYTGDASYLLEGGLEVLIGIARFWAQRTHLSGPKGKYVILGVTGPNEYENNVDNNWYTNLMAQWCLQYAGKCIEETRGQNAAILEKCDVTDQEISGWLNIAENLYFPESEKHGVFLQQDNYLEKEQLTVDELPDEVRPLNQNWSWDRILRSCFIKQADVLQGLFFFEDQFDLEVIRRNFDFYEPRTVHESSLSPCVHSILASYLGKHDKAYEMYLRTARLDLEDYNNDTGEGLHITSMAGTWMTIVKGFAGIRVHNDQLDLSPSLPPQWTSIEFKMHFRGNRLLFLIKHDSIEIGNLHGPDLAVTVMDQEITIASGGTARIDIQ